MTAADVAELVYPALCLAPLVKYGAGGRLYRKRPHGADVAELVYAPA